MSNSYRKCVFCDYNESEHGRNGLSSCTAYEPTLRPRVHIPTFDSGEVLGRGTFKTYDPMLDYILLEVPTEDWTVAYLLVVQDGSFVVAEMRIFPTEPAGDAEPGEWSGEVNRVPIGGLTARRLRRVGVADHRTHSQAIHDTVREAMGDAAFGSFMEERGLSEERLAAFAAPRELSSDRATRLAQIVSLYVTAANTGNRSPVAAVAERLDVPRSSVRDQLHDAREMGLLEGSGVGVAGGLLTAKARELLRATTTKEER
jgi:hypothetical protein